MRTLLLFRGAPGCGKSTFIDIHGLRPYALSADDIRQTLRSPMQTADGSVQICQDNEKEVWELLYRMLETRMQKGEFTVIDATNSKTSEMNKYKDLCGEYRYRMFCIDMTDLPIEECKRRNAGRIPLKRVPDEVIDKMYSRFRTQKIPSGFKVLKKDQLDQVYTRKFDMSEYEKVVVVGDVHGAYTALMEYFSKGFNDNYFYIFVGDIIDRGIENSETVKFFIEAVKRKNVLVLEGNHECFHKDTEVLTKCGWKYIKDVDIDTDEVAQFNINTTEMTFEKPLDIIKNKSDYMIDIETNNMHQVVTPNHDVVFRGKKLKACELLNIDDVTPQDFPISVNIDNCDCEIDDNTIKMIVWIVCDGTIVRSQTGIKTRVQFHLSREDKIENLCKLLDDMNIEYSKCACKPIEGRKQAYFIRFYGDDARKFDSILNHKKEFPDIFMHLSKRQMFVVASELIKTDGRKVSGNKFEISTISKHDCDMMQALFTMHGGSCTVTVKDNSLGFNKNGKIYVLSVKVSSVYPSYKISINKIEYNDDVYCLTMPLGTLVTRFNGKVALSGNCSLKKYSNNGVSRSKEFEFVTRKQLDASDIDKKDIRQLCRKLGQAAWFTYGDKEILVTHGGLATMPENLSFMATDQMIHGVGDYNDSDIIADTWLRTTADNMYQVHGHRNVKNVPMKVNDRVYNLEGKVEFGGFLRILELDKDGFHEVEIKNAVFKTPEAIAQSVSLSDSSIADIVLKMRQNKFIQEKSYGNISSFNFTREAFYDKVWDDQTVKARGLYIDTDRMKVSCRGFVKFFNINERPECRFEMLQHTLQFPVTCYVKENGFLGLVSYNPDTDDLFITTKSSPEGPYAEWLKDMVYRKVQNIDLMKQICKEQDITFVFECVDMKNDPHIIKYQDDELFLLAIVKNSMDFIQHEYDDLVNTANEIGVKCKTKAVELGTWAEFVDWYNEVLDPDYEFNGRIIEGFVIEDSAGYMTKVKLTYYNFWKFMRGLTHEVLQRGYFHKTSALTTPTANDYYGFIKGIYDQTDKETRQSMPRDIIYWRDRFYKEN